MIYLEMPQRKWASSVLEGRTSWIFSSCGRWSRLTTGTYGTRSGGLRKGQSPCELLGGFSGFLSRRCRGLRPCVESVPETEDSSPVLTWILGYFWSIPRGVSPRLVWGHALALSSRAVAAVSRFPSRGSSDLWLFLEAFQGGILSIRGRVSIPGVPVASQEEALSTGKARGTPGSCHHSQSPPDVSVHSRETCFPCTASTFKPRIDSHHGGTWDSPVGKPRGKASWESLVGKPRG